MQYFKCNAVLGNKVQLEELNSGRIVSVSKDVICSKMTGGTIDVINMLVDKNGVLVYKSPSRENIVVEDNYLIGSKIDTLAKRQVSSHGLIKDIHDTLKTLIDTYKSTECKCANGIKELLKHSDNERNKQIEELKAQVNLLSVSLDEVLKNTDRNYNSICKVEDAIADAVSQLTDDDMKILETLYKNKDFKCDFFVSDLKSLIGYNPRIYSSQAKNWLNNKDGFVDYCSKNGIKLDENGYNELKDFMAGTGTGLAGVYNLREDTKSFYAKNLEEADKISASFKTSVSGSVSSLLLIALLGSLIKQDGVKETFGLLSAASLIISQVATSEGRFKSTSTLRRFNAAPVGKHGDYLSEYGVETIEILKKKWVYDSDVDIKLQAMLEWQARVLRPRRKFSIGVRKLSNEVHSVSECLGMSECNTALIKDTILFRFYGIYGYIQCCTLHAAVTDGELKDYLSSYSLFASAYYAVLNYYNANNKGLLDNTIRLMRPQIGEGVIKTELASLDCDNIREFICRIDIVLIVNSVKPDLICDMNNKFYKCIASCYDKCSKDSILPDLFSDDAIEKSSLLHKIVDDSKNKYSF